MAGTSLSLLVPIALIDGDLQDVQFAQVGHNATVQEVLDKLLLQNPNVKKDILGDLEDQGWALQKLRSETTGRRWEEDELEALGDGEHRYAQ